MTPSVSRPVNPAMVWIPEKFDPDDDQRGNQPDIERRHQPAAGDKNAGDQRFEAFDHRLRLRVGRADVNRWVLRDALRECSLG
jgi:hypothetical protein